MKTSISRRRSKLKSKRSKHRKRFQKGGNTYEIIVTAIDQITNVSSLSTVFQVLADNYNAITPYQMNLLLSKLVSASINENEVVFPEVIENIKQIYFKTTNLWRSKLFQSLYLTFPLSKINLDMNEIRFQKKDILLNGKIYNFYNGGAFGMVCVNKNVNEAIKVIDYSKKSENKIIDLIDDEIINYNNISQLACNSNYFCKLMDIFINPRFIFVRMEFCGIDMVDVVGKHNTFSFDTFLRWFINIAKGVKCMHDNNYVHLDIKPENITVLNETAKLIDFGLSFLIKPGVNPIFTRGTPGYVAPEMGYSNIDYKKCDVYSLGRTMAELLFYRYIRLDTKFNFEKNKCLHLIGLYHMIDTNNERRPSIDEVIQKLEIKLKGLHSSERQTDYFFTIAELKQAEFTFFEILQIYKLSDVMKVYSLEELKNGGVPLSYFLNQKIAIKQLITDAKFTLKELLQFTTLRDLINAGISFEELKEKGINLYQFYSNGFSIRELKNSGAFDFQDFIKYLNKLHDVSYNEFIKGGFTISDLYDAGIPLNELKNYFTIEELKKSDRFQLKDFIDNKFKLYNLMRVFSAERLIEAGISIKDFFEAGVRVWEITGPGKFELQDFLKNRHYPLRDLHGHFTVEQLKTAGVNLGDFVKNGFSISELNGSFNFDEFIKNKHLFSLKELNKVFSVKELKDAGISINEFIAEGFMVSELNKPGYFNLNDFLQTNAALDGKIPIKNVEILDLIQGGFTVKELQAAGVKANDLKNVVSVEQMFKSGYKYGEIRDIYKDYKNRVMQSPSSQDQLAKLKELQKILNRCKDWKGKRNTECTFSP